jgi:hypothetical protein
MTLAAHQRPLLPALIDELPYVPETIQRVQDRNHRLPQSINGITDPDAGPFERAILRPRPARPARTSAEASGAAVSSGVAIREHGGAPGASETTRRHRIRRAPDQQSHRHMPVRGTDAAVAGLASTVRPETSDKGREVGQMCGWDLCGGRQMLQTIRRENPRQVTPEDLSDTSLLGAGEHGGAIVVDQHPVGQWPRPSSESRSSAPRPARPRRCAARSDSCRQVTELVVASPKGRPLRLEPHRAAELRPA